MHITYEFHKFLANVHVSSNNNKQSPLEIIDQRIKNLRAEEEAIIKVCTQLSQFLRVNALNPVNDDILEYIQHFIREEKLKKTGDPKNDDVIAGLEKLLIDYTREMELLNKTMKISQTTTSTNHLYPTNNVIKPEEIFTLVGTLYRLPINGSKIRAQIDELKRVQHRSSLDREQTVNLPAQAASSTVMSELKTIL